MIQTAASIDRETRENIAAALGGFAERNWPLTRVRALGKAAEFPFDCWRGLADLGWFAALRPEDEGGLGLGAAEAAILFEHSGRHLFPGPLFDTVVVPPLAGVPASLLDDAPLISLAWEPESGTAPVRRSDGRVHGRDVLVEHADIANLLIASVGDSGLRGVVVLDARATEIAIDPLPAIDPLSRPCLVSFDGVRPLHELAARSEAELLVRRVQNWALTMHAAALLGIAERTLQMSVEHARNRRQFGRSVGSFQAVQHRLADMAVLTTTGRSICGAALRALELRLDDSESPRVANAYLSGAVQEVAESAIQVHGAIGFTADHDLHLYVKRALTLEGAWGDAAEHAELLARGLLARTSDNA